MGGPCGFKYPVSFQSLDASRIPTSPFSNDAKTNCVDQGSGEAYRKTKGLELRHTSTGVRRRRNLSRRRRRRWWRRLRSQGGGGWRREKEN